MGSKIRDMSESHSQTGGQFTSLARGTTEVASGGRVSSNAGDADLPPISARGSANLYELSEGWNIGIIIDGNRRFAEREGIGLVEAYTRGSEKVYEIVRYIFEETGAREISVYAISYENLMRTPEEVDPMLKIEKQSFDNWAGDPFFKEKGIRVRFVGEKDTLPAEFLESCNALERITSENGERTLNILVAYSGQKEMNHVVKEIVRDVTSKGLDVESIDIEMLIAKTLYISKPIDLIIRTGGGCRLSGFPPLPSGYAEMFVSPELWPAIKKDDIKRAFMACHRGKTKHGL